MKVRTGLGGVFLAALSACGTTPNTASPAPAPVVPTTSSPSPQRPGPRVVYTSAKDTDVWMDSLEAGTRRRLTTNGAQREEFEPRFAGPNAVTYWAGNALEKIDLQTGTISVLVARAGSRVADETRAHAWTPDGGVLAYLAQTGVDDQGSMRFDLVIADRAGKTRTRTRLPILLPEGIGGFCRGEGTNVSISSDGSLVAVELYRGVGKVNAAFVSGDGKLLGNARDLYGIRIVDASTVYARSGLWIELNPATGAESALETVPPGTVRVALSPDRRELAVELGVEEGGPKVLAIDLASGRRREIGTGISGPVRLSGDRFVVVTGPKPHCWDGGVYASTITAGGQPKRVGLEALGTIDVFL